MNDLFNKAIAGRRKHYSSSSNSESSSGWSESPPAESKSKRVPPVPFIPDAAATAARNAQIEQARAWELEHPAPPPPPDPPVPPPAPFVRPAQYKPQPVPVYKQVPQQVERPPSRQPPPPLIETESSPETEGFVWGNGDSQLVTPVQEATRGDRTDYFNAEHKGPIDVGGKVNIKSKIKNLEKTLPFRKEGQTTDEGVYTPSADQRIPNSKSRANSLPPFHEMTIPPKHREVTVLPTTHEVNGQLLGFGERLNDIESVVRKVPKVESAVRKELHGLNHRLDDLGETVSALPEWQNKFNEEHAAQLNELGGVVQELQETHELSPTLRKTIKEGRKLGEVMEVFNEDIQRNRQQVETHESRLNNVDNQLKEKTKGVSESQAKMLKQLQSVRRTQNWLAAGLGIIGLSGLGFLAYKTISDIMKNMRNGAKKPKRPNPAATAGGAPEMSQVGGGPIKKRLHAREFNRVHDHIYYR